MSTPPLVLVYLRISQDRDATGEMRSVANQRADLAGVLERLGASSPEEFVDNDTSASTGVARPGYAALKARVEEAIGPVVIVAWAVDRLYRRPRELEDLVDLVEARSVRIETARGGGLDLNTHEGRLQARLLVSMAAWESGHRSDRVRLANRAKGARGDWHGPRRYGYQLVGDGSADLDRDEAPIIQEMVRRVLAGESLRSIAADLNERGIPTVGGKRWQGTSVRSVVTAPRLAGIRVHLGAEVSGRWPALISTDDHRRIVAMVSAPDRRTSKSGLHLLSGIAECGRCGAGLTIVYHGDRTSYGCVATSTFPDRGGVSIKRDFLDAVVTEAVLVRLGASDLTSETHSESPRDPALADLEAAQERLTTLAEDFGAGLLPRDAFLAATRIAQQSVEAAQVKVSRRSTSAAVRGLSADDPTALREAWEAMTLPQRRAVITELVDELVIAPSDRARGRLPPDLARIKLRWRGE